MKWSDVGDLIKSSAPLVASFFMSPASVPISIIALLANKFGLKQDCKPDELYEAIKQDQAAHEKLTELQMQSYVQLEQISASVAVTHNNNLRHLMMREYSLDSKFKSYWRPSFGYMLVIIIPIIVLWLVGLASFVFFYDPDKLGLLQSVLNIILSPVFNLLTWCVGVLGVNIYHRSQDKSALLGKDKKTIVSRIGEIFSRK